MNTQNSPSTGSSAVQLILYWAIVGVPLAWGVYMTALKLPAFFQPRPRPAKPDRPPRNTRRGRFFAPIQRNCHGQDNFLPQGKSILNPSS